MEKRTREILALILLIVLGIAVVSAMGWYILVGHNWNQAATHIDDLVGSMDGYTVVIYEGNAKRPKSQAHENENARASQATKNNPETSITDSKGHDIYGSRSAPPISDDTSRSDGVVRSSDAESQNALPVEDPTGQVSDPESSDVQPVAIHGSPNASASTMRIDPHVIADRYREKGASVILLDSNMSTYEDPWIISRNGNRIGVFSFDGKYRYNFAAFRSKIRYLQRCSVDFTIAICADKTLLKGRLSGINLMIVNKDVGIREGGEYRGQTLCVDSPFTNEVQAVIVSPSGVLTSRTIREL